MVCYFRVVNIDSIGLVSWALLVLRIMFLPGVALGIG